MSTVERLCVNLFLSILLPWVICFKKIFIYLYYILEFFCESRSEVFSSESVKVKFTQLCPTLSDPVDYVVHGILQARVLEWVAFPSPGDLPNPGIEPRSPALQAYALPTELCGKRLRIQKGLHIKAKLGGEGGMDQELERWHPTPVRLPGKSRGWRSLVGCSPWGR